MKSQIGREMTKTNNQTQIEILADLAASIKWPTFLSNGACVGSTDPTLFDDEDPTKTVIAKAICRQCPVKQQCAEWGIANEPSGVWGGMDEADRVKARRGKRKFISIEKRREDLEWLGDMLSEKSATELAEKYGKTERTIYRWRKRLQKKSDISGVSTT